MVDSFAASPIHSRDFCKKKCFMKQVKPFSSHCLTTEEPEQLKTLFIGQALHNQMQNTDIYVYQLPNFKRAQKAKFQDSFWVLK